MKRFSVYCFGKTSNKAISSLITDYQKKLSSMLKFEFIELKDGKSLDAEANQLLKRLPKHAYFFLLDEHGKSYTSVGFSQQLEKLTLHYQHFVFIIGSAYGLSDKLRAHASEIISLSDMTFTHEMIRAFLLEQLYRSEMIQRGRAYHH